MTLREIMTDLTDKADHGYCEAYERILGPRREEPLELLELGTMSGGSLLAWAEWMPNAYITGVDIEPTRWITHPRIWLVKCDVLSFAPDRRYDVIIDDIHVHGTTEPTFGQLWPWLNPGGHYFLEDVSTLYPEIRALGEFTEVHEHLLHFKKGD